MRCVGRLTVIACFLFSGARAEGLPAGFGGVSLSGKVEVEVAEMLKARKSSISGGTSRSSTQTHAWTSHLIGTLDFAARPDETFELRGSFEFRQYSQYNLLMSASYNLGDYLNSDTYLREAQGIFLLSKNGSASVEAAIGLMPYKYNAEVREFGEFLFRSGTYPFYLLGEFDRPFARLTGLRLGVRAGDEKFGWKMDWFAMTEREMRPFWDISLAAVAGVNFGKLFDIGAGVNFAHIIPFNSNLTTPKESKYGTGKYISDSVAVTDALGNIIGWNYNSAYYTYKGTKLMARMTIDPFGTVRGEESFIGALVGENSGKLYGEWAVIGLESYPANNSSNIHGYARLKEKMPWMVGVSFPLWKILDVCLFEIERFPNPTPNAPTNIIKYGFPLPWYTSANANDGYDTGLAYVPRWYWSLYLKKQVIKNFSIICQMGRDHIHWEQPLNYQTSAYDYEEAMVKPDEWGWHLKAEYNF
jgi:hypothetical protein